MDDAAALLKHLLEPTDRAIQNLRNQVAALADNQDSIARSVQHVARMQGASLADEPEPAKPPQRDVLWQCKKCGSKLGWYDKDDDVLRMKHKDSLVWVQLKADSWVRCACTKCGELNEVGAS